MSASIGRDFMEKTTYAQMGPSQQRLGFPQPPLQEPPVEGQYIINLPAPDEIFLPGVDLRRAIEARRSLRSYTDTPLSLEELSLLLWLTQGVKEVTDRPSTLRNVPSAGARHAFETYLVANRVNSLLPGLYRFLAIEHRLIEIDHSPSWGEELASVCQRQGHITRSAVTFIWVAQRARMFWRYGERGYRYLHLDAGHACQNLYLAAEAMNCGVCAIGAFDDDKVNTLLSLDGVEQFVIYLASLGKKG